jgi:hypothetical protein
VLHALSYLRTIHDAQRKCGDEQYHHQQILHNVSPPVRMTSAHYIEEASTRHNFLFRGDLTGVFAYRSSSVIVVPQFFQSRENVTGPCSTYLHESSTINLACFIASKSDFHGAS